MAALRLFVMWCLWKLRLRSDVQTLAVDPEAEEFQPVIHDHPEFYATVERLDACKFGTVFVVPALQRVFVCVDQGNLVGDGNLDIWMGSREDALAFGVQHFEVEVRKWVSLSSFQPGKVEPYWRGSLPRWRRFISPTPTRSSWPTVTPPTERRSSFAQ